jgi:hypothetical protein
VELNAKNLITTAWVLGAVVVLAIVVAIVGRRYKAAEQAAEEAAEKQKIAAFLAESHEKEEQAQHEPTVESRPQPERRSGAASSLDPASCPKGRVLIDTNSRKMITCTGPATAGATPAAASGDIPASGTHRCRGGRHQLDVGLPR